MRYGLDPPLKLVRPSTCNWCGGSLRHLRHVYKGIGSESEYCSEKCLVRGLERTARAAGTVASPWYVGVAAIIAVAMMTFALTPKARAHDPLTHQVNEYSVAKSKSGGLCCDGKDYTYVNPYSWERTDKGYRVHIGGKWVDVPKDFEVNNMRNPDGEAKVWIMLDESGEPFVRCFMPGVES